MKNYIKDKINTKCDHLRSKDGKYKPCVDIKNPLEEYCFCVIRY